MLYVYATTIVASLYGELWSISHNVTMSSVFHVIIVITENVNWCTEWPYKLSNVNQKTRDDIETSSDFGVRILCIAMVYNAYIHKPVTWKTKLNL